MTEHVFAHVREVCALRCSLATKTDSQTMAAAYRAPLATTPSLFLAGRSGQRAGYPVRPIRRYADHWNSGTSFRYSYLLSRYIKDIYVNVAYMLRPRFANTDGALHISRMRKGSVSGKCTACRHEHRPRIERALAAGATLRATAAKYGLRYDSLRRHWLNHVSDERKVSIVAGSGLSRDRLEEMVCDEDVSIIDHLKIVRSRLYVAFDGATDVGDRGGIDRLAGRLHENLRLSATLTGELIRSPLLSIQNNSIQISAHPDFSRAIARIVAAVSRFPEARQSVIAALRDLDGLPSPTGAATGALIEMAAE